MTRCFDCRAPVSSERFVCDACYTKKQDALTVDQLRGIHGTRGLGGAKVHLSAAERKSIERLTGVKVFDAQDARRAIKAKGMRFLESGEELDETLKKQEAGEKVPFPGWDRLGVMKAPKPFNFEERYAANRERYGER